MVRAKAAHVAEDEKVLMLRPWSSSRSRSGSSPSPGRAPTRRRSRGHCSWRAGSRWRGTRSSFAEAGTTRAAPAGPGGLPGDAALGDQVAARCW